MSGFNFGTPNAANTSLPAFGAASSTTGFSFGTPSNQAAPAGAANLSFGTPKSTGFNFGAPTAASTATQGFSLGQPQQPASGFSLGGTPTASVQPQPQQTGVSFGLTQSQPQQTGVSFGISQQQQPQQSSVSFGSQQQQPQSTGLSFGQQPSAVPTMQSTALSFSTPASQPTTAFSFSQPTATAVVAPTSVAPLSTFGMPSSTPQSQAQPATGFAFGQSAQTTVTTAAPGLSFGLPAATTTTGLTLNPLTTTAPATGLAFGSSLCLPTTQAPSLFGAPQSQAQQQPSLLSSLTQPLAAVPASSAIANPPQTLGLGGIDMNTTQPKAVEGKNESTKVKESQVPKEIIQNVDDFKAYVKQQKTLSSDIIRTTDRKMKSVTEETQRLNCNVQDVSNNVDNNKLTIKLLRSDTSKVIQHADMAQRTHETPSGLQFENIMPQIYFNELIHKYENDLLTLKHQVELTEKHLQSLSNPQNFTAQDLKRGLHQIHESFIALAGRLQETHTKVDTQKEQYLSLRKFLLRDTTNVFEVEQSTSSAGNTSKIQYGPNPFTSSMLGTGLNLSQSAAKQWSAPPQQQQQNTSSFFGNSSFNFK